MSKYFAETNTENALVLFNKRFIYKKMVFGAGVRNIVSFIDGEKIFYGRINRKFVPIEIGQASLKPIKNVADSGRPLMALNFVVDMFDELATQMQKQAISGRIDRNHPFLSEIKAHKALVSPQKSYAAYKTVYFDTLKNLMHSNSMNKFKNFDEFMATLMSVLHVSIKKQPFTYTGYLKSTKCTVMSSGMAIEIADVTHMDDLQKFDTFVQSPNWSLFVNACNTYGFMIDYNAPWRIVADIGADNCLVRASRYGGATVEQILANSYEPASRRSIKRLSKDLFELYNFVKLNYYDELTTCPDGEIKIKTIVPKTYSLEKFNQKYSELYFLKVYLNLRLQEEQPNMAEVDRNKIIDEQMKVVKATNDIASVHKKFESIINKTFDKRGSLSYAIYADQLKTLQKFEDKKIDNITITSENDGFSGY